MAGEGTWRHFLPAIADRDAVVGHEVAEPTMRSGDLRHVATTVNADARAR